MQSFELSKIVGNPYQTRIGVDLEYIERLAADIEENDLQQYPVGRMVGDQVQLAFGHNRLEAYKWLAEKKRIAVAAMPVEIKVLSDEQMAMLAWSENEHRQQLNPVERALAIERFMKSFGWTQDRVAEKLGISRSTVANMLRLLTLPPHRLENIKNGELSTRQAMALLPFYALPQKDQNWILADEDRSDFLEAAGRGQVDSDSIRMQLNEYLEALEKSKPRQMTLEAEPEEGEESAPPVVRDELDLLRQAVEAIRGERSIDLTFLQRKLRIPILTAQRLIRVLRESGSLAEPVNGMFPVLISPPVDPKSPDYPVARQAETASVCAQTMPEMVDVPEDLQVTEVPEDEPEAMADPEAEPVPAAAIRESVLQSEIDHRLAEPVQKPEPTPEPAPKPAAEPEQTARPMLQLTVIWYGDSAVMSCRKTGEGLPKFITFPNLPIFNLGFKAAELIPEDWKNEFIK